MNKTELIAAMAEKTGITKTEAGEVLNAFTDTVEDVLAHGGKVVLMGFGTFESKLRAARAAKNPRTGAAVTIPACKTPVFKPGKAFKDLIRK